MTITADQIRLEMTCGACPEQYDAFVGDKWVAYLHLRYGRFSVNCESETVYTADTRGDGIFEESERDYHLARAKAAIVAHLSPAPPTFGEIYEQLQALKDAGVTLESLMWVAKEKVWWE